MARKANGKRRLGRGLGSLIQTPVRVDLPDESSVQSEAPADQHARDGSHQDAAPEMDYSRTQAAGLAAAHGSSSSVMSTASQLEQHGLDEPGGQRRRDLDSPQVSETAADVEDAGGDVDPVARMLPIDSIRANPDQPRRTFDEEALEALAASIRSAGLMQPIVVRPDGSSFQIIAGERRWRAAQKVGLQAIPAVIHDVDDRQVAEWSLVENLQREDLNPIEKAHAFQRLSDEFDLTHQQIADAVGLNRASVTNHIRLLELDSATLELVEKNLLTLGHARALLALSTVAERQKVAAMAVREAWSVRAIEEQIRKRSARQQGRASEAAGGSGADQPIELRLPTGREANLRDLEKRLGDHLGTRVTIKPGRKKGAGMLMIEFYDNKQFEGLLDHIRFSIY